MAYSVLALLGKMAENYTTSSGRVSKSPDFYILSPGKLNFIRENNSCNPSYRYTCTRFKVIYFRVCKVQREIAVTIRLCVIFDNFSGNNNNNNTISNYLIAEAL